MADDSVVAEVDKNEVIDNVEGDKCGNLVIVAQKTAPALEGENETCTDNIENNSEAAVENGNGKAGYSDIFKLEDARGEEGEDWVVQPALEQHDP